MNLLQVDTENNILHINDEAKLQRNSMILFMSINLLNAILNILKLHKEEFNFLHGIWLVLGIISIVMLLLERNKTISQTINISTIDSYSYKENICDSSGHIIIHLNNKKKRYISVTTQTQLEVVENILTELNIQKNAKIKKNIN
jgi:hypothetical protein